MVNLRQHNNCRGDVSNRCRVMGIYQFFFNMAAVRRLGFVLRVFQPRMKSRSLLLCKIWLESKQEFR